MAGGRGTRLWPLSRSAAPKQFIQILDDDTLFQNTLRRVSDTALYEAPVIVTNEDSRFLVAEQARQIDMPLAQVLLEPVARNTAAAIAAAAVFVARTFGEGAVMQVLASDHEINAEKVYFDCVRTALATAHTGKLVTFGIDASEPATGYGYIEQGEALSGGGFTVKRFVEKPDREKAEEMLAQGGFYWNSGMFMFPVEVLIEEMRTLCPDVLDAAERAVAAAKTDLDFNRLDADAFAASPDISIDYAVMERTGKAAVVPSAFEWSDLGSWDSIWKLGKKDENGNVKGRNTTAIGTTGSLVISRGPHLAVQGMEGVVVVASEDAVYVGRLDDSQSVGKVVKHLDAEPKTSYLTELHPTTHRPWGGYTSALAGDRFEVKRIFVLPGKMISLQKHHHRAEHWVVVKGTAEVTIGERRFTVGENQSVYIPQGEIHRLGNPGKIMLELIEVRTGSYLGEDDTIRFEDEYGRD